MTLLSLWIIRKNWKSEVDKATINTLKKRSSTIRSYNFGTFSYNKKTYLDLLICILDKSISNFPLTNENLLTIVIIIYMNQLQFPLAI